MTPEVEEVALLALEQHAAGVGTYHAGWAAELFGTPKRCRAGDGGILGGAGAGRVEPRLRKVQLGRGQFLARQPVQYHTQLPRGGYVIHQDVPERALGHAGIGCLLRLLHEGEPTARLDLDESGGTVIQRSGQDDAHDPGAEGARGAAEERVDRGAVSLLPRPVGEPDASPLQEEVVVGAGDVDAAGTIGSPSTAWATGILAARRRIAGKALTLWGGKWCTTNTAPGKSAGSAPTSRSRGSMPPAENPTTTMSRTAMHPIPL